MGDMTKYKEALKDGQELRKLQDEALALFVFQIQKVTDKATLLEIKKQLSEGLL